MAVKQRSEREYVGRKIHARELTRVMDSEFLSHEEQAELVSSQMALRGCTQQIEGAVTKLRGLMMRSNALMRRERITAVLDEISELIADAKQEVRQLGTE